MKVVLFALLTVMGNATPVYASPSSATATAVVRVQMVKALTLTATQDLDLGTIVLTPGNWPDVAVGISRAGIRNCSSSQLVCVGNAQVAKFRVSGSNKETIGINAPDVLLTNQSDSSKILTMTVDSPGTIVLSNSGNSGQEFALGGSIMVSSSTADGLYSGTFNVTVDYR